MYRCALLSYITPPNPNTNANANASSNINSDPDPDPDPKTYPKTPTLGSNAKL